MKAKIQIKTFSGKLLFEYESDNNSIKKTLEEGVKSGADLRGADLSGAYLSGAYLSGAYLSGAYLRGAYLRGAYFRDADLSSADLRGAYLRGVYLRGAYLRGAYLSGAYLRGAYLRGAYFRDADLSGAYLSGAYLSGADLSGADLRGADLSVIKKSLHSILSKLNGEVKGLLKAIRVGKINGSVYEGDCACLVGTIAKLKECNYNEIENINPDSSRPIERFFLSIRPGHTPKNSKKCKEIESWIVEYIESTKTLEK